jgi:hypothetical protein
MAMATILMFSNTNCRTCVGSSSEWVTSIKMLEANCLDEAESKGAVAIKLSAARDLGSSSKNAVQ